MPRKSHNNRTKPTNDTKRKSKQTMTDSSQTTKTKKKQTRKKQNKKNKYNLPQQGNHNVKQDPLNTTRQRTAQNTETRNQNEIETQFLSAYCHKTVTNRTMVSSTKYLQNYWKYFINYRIWSFEDLHLIYIYEESATSLILMNTIMF